MNRDQVIGRWQEVVGRIKECCGDVTGAQLLTAVGREARLAGRIRARRGLSTAQADRQLREFVYRNRHWKITG